MRRIASCAAGLLFAPLVTLAVQPPDAAPKKPSPRRLVHPRDLSDVHPTVRPYVEGLLTRDKPFNPDAVVRGGVFLRVVSRAYAVDDRGEITDRAWLGSRPFVFLTTPEAAYGRTLLQTFSAIGYDPEDALEAEAGEDKVAVVFTYQDGMPTAGARACPLPDAWGRHVYPATWDNLFALAGRLAAGADRVKILAEGSPFTPDQLLLRSERERSFLLGFPDAGRRRVAATPYGTLQDVGGADWEYRQLLERTLGASEHFRGDGLTKLTRSGQRPGRPGYPEFLGPNAKLRDLPAVAVVSLGSLPPAGR